MRETSCSRTPTLSQFVCQWIFVVILLTTQCNADCGFPIIPSGLQTVGFNNSVSYGEGSSFTAFCSEGLVPVAYNITCHKEQWVIHSDPPALPYQPCLTPNLQDLPIKKFYSIFRNGSTIRETRGKFDPQSGCHSSSEISDQIWSIHIGKPFDPCIMIVKIRIDSFSRESVLAMSDISQLPHPRFSSDQSVNCTFMRYSVTRESPFLNAVFACDYRKSALILSHNFPDMMEFRKMNKFMIDFARHSLNFTASFCGISIQECERFTCGTGYPSPLRSTSTRQQVLVVTPDDEEAENWETNDTIPPHIAGGEGEGETAAVLTLPGRVVQRTIRIVFSCDDGYELVTDGSYDVFGGLVCGPHGTWLSSVPSCLPAGAGTTERYHTDPTWAPMSTSDIICVTCPYFTCLLIIFIILLSVVIFLCTFNYLWLKQREKRMLISGRDSLLWVRKDLIRAGGRQSCESGHRNLTRNSSICSKNLSCSYIDIQGNMFDVPCAEDFNATTYFYLNRYEAISTEHVPQPPFQLQSQQKTEVILKHEQASDPETESDESDKDSKSNLKY